MKTRKRENITQIEKSSHDISNNAKLEREERR
jgi:hypothetical protein